MTKVVLIQPASLKTMGFQFLKGVAREDIPDEVVAELRSNPRFEVDGERGDDSYYNPEAGDLSKQEVRNPRRVKVKDYSPEPAPENTNKPNTVKPEPVPETGRPQEEAARIYSIREAIELLDRDNEDHFTNAGKPDARALSSLLGWGVTAAERDEAWGHGSESGSDEGDDTSASDSSEDGEDDAPADDAEAGAQGSGGSSATTQSVNEPNTPPENAGDKPPEAPPAAEPVNKDASEGGDKPKTVVKLKAKPHTDDNKPDPTKGGAVEV